MGNHCTRNPCCRKVWSCICCCSSRNRTQAWSKKSCYIKGMVHPVSRIEKWEEKMTEAKRNGKILVVNFKASWCLPSKEIEPIYHELASTYTSMIFVTIDVEELAEFRNEWNVEATPTVVFLKDGRQMDKLVGGDAAELQKKTAAAADLLLRQS
ncbi:hypothetical protein CARUB_v10025342mg [Capsella rubella]|uniref:Thioredoxin domain-containing protein n=1 Tax=Capsella rubella TaxID=81985 RepID=R0HQR5_9BRAS|nr:thioredoxin-like protein CXXS2 [Capsella rubella]EOA26323.1 hypothetical protein CARUB_v10025342mg [Capsella rubella]